MICPNCGNELQENYDNEDLQNAVDERNQLALNIFADMPPYLCTTDSRAYWPSELGAEPDPTEDAKAHIADLRERLAESSGLIWPRRIENA